MSIDRRQPSDLLAPRPRSAARTQGITDWVTPPPELPQPALAALAVPTTFGANITEVWYCVMTKLAPMVPMRSRKNRNMG